MSDYTPAFLVFASDVGFFHNVARNYKRDALKLKANDYSECTPTFHLLSTLAIELFPKVLRGFSICLSYKDNRVVSEVEIRKRIEKDISQYRHNLDKLYKSFPELMSHLCIKNITNFSNEFVWEYRIEMYDQCEIAIKHLEAVRYGTFAKKRDLATWCINDPRIVALLNNLEEYVVREEKKTHKILSNYLQ